MKNRTCFKEMNWNLISKYRDQLFGIAILSIMIFHYSMDFNKTLNPERFLFRAIYWSDLYFSAVGVEIFAALSGMGLYYSFSKDQNISHFYIRRIKRLLIPYLIVAIPFWYIRDIFILNRGFTRMIKDLCFVTFFTDGVTTFWYILFSIVMYALFPIIYHLLNTKKFLNTKKYRWMHFVLLIIGACTLSGCIYYLNENLYWNIYLAVTRIPVFIFGCFFAKYIKEGKTSPFIIWVLLAIFGFFIRAFLLQMQMPNFLWQYVLWFMMIGIVPFLIIILDKVLKYHWIHTTLGHVGRLSLELYMIHIAVRNLYNTLKLTMDKLGIIWVFLLVSVFALAEWLSKLTKIINLNKNKK